MKQIGAAMNLLDELASISGEWKFSAWYLSFPLLGFVIPLPLRAAFHSEGAAPPQRTLAVPCGRVDAACVQCKGGSASVVRRSSIPLQQDPPRSVEAGA